MATKRLKLAQKLLNDGKKDQFYDEVLKSVWNYLSDKLAISPALLTKEKVEFELCRNVVLLQRRGETLREMRYLCRTQRGSSRGRD